jgi:hypothetical protein
VRVVYRPYERALLRITLDQTSTFFYLGRSKIPIKQLYDITARNSPDVAECTVFQLCRIKKYSDHHVCHCGRDTESSSSRLGALDEVRGSPAAHACRQHYIHLLLGCGMASYGLLGRVNRLRRRPARLRAMPTLPTERERPSRQSAAESLLFAFRQM